MKHFGTLLLVLLMPWMGARAQSLGELARKEAERRKLLEKQGIEGKVLRIDKQASGVGENPAASRPAAGAAAGPGRPLSSGSRSTAASYRLALSKLDSEISECENRLARLRERQDTEKKSLVRSGKLAAGESAKRARERLLSEVQKQEYRLKRLRQERLEKYDAGRKAGFLPGELDGHGIIP